MTHLAALAVAILTFWVASADGKTSQSAKPGTQILGWVVDTGYFDNNCLSKTPSSVRYSALGLCQPEYHEQVNKGFFTQTTTKVAGGKYLSLLRSNYIDANCTVKSKSTLPETTISGACSVVAPGPPTSPHLFGQYYSFRASVINEPVFPNAEFVGVGFAVSTSSGCDPKLTYEYHLINPSDSSGTPNCIYLSTGATSYSYQVGCASNGASPTVKKFAGPKCLGKGTTSGIFDLALAIYGGGPSCSHSQDFKGYTKLLRCTTNIGVGSTLKTTTNTNTTTTTASKSAPSFTPEPEWVEGTVVAICISFLCFIVMTVIVKRRMYFAQKAREQAASLPSQAAMSPIFGVAGNAGDVIPEQEKKPAPQPQQPAKKQQDWQTASL